MGFEMFSSLFAFNSCFYIVCFCLALRVQFNSFMLQRNYYNAKLWYLEIKQLSLTKRIRMQI